MKFVVEQAPTPLEIHAEALMAGTRTSGALCGRAIIFARATREYERVTCEECQKLLTAETARRLGAPEK